MLRPVEDLAVAAEEARHTFRPGVGGLVYLWTPWPTPSLGSHGWELDAHPTFAVRAPGGPLPAVAGVRVERVSDAAMLAEWERVIVDGFAFEDLQPHVPRALVGEALLDDPHARLWIAYDGSRPAAAAALHIEHGIAGFALGATLPDARRQGLWYALVRERLLECPDLVAASVFSSMSRPGAELVGFLPIGRWTLWRRPRP